MEFTENKPVYSSESSEDTQKISDRKLVLPAGFTITAHAGALDYPPNTEIALAKAIESGAADIIETDVAFRPDGTPVIIHKENPATGEGVLLSNALELAASHETISINLDLKSFSNLKAVEGLVNQFGLQNRAFFTGVDENRVSLVKHQCPDIPLYLNASIDASAADNMAFAENMAEKILSLGCIGLNCHYGNITRALADCLHRYGLLLSVWTVDNESDMYKMLSISPDNITTKRPVLLKGIIEKRLE